MSMSFAHFPLLTARPGGMRGAIESAAHVVDMSWRVEPKTEAFRYLRPLSYLSPAAMCIPPGRAKIISGLTFVIFKRH